MKNNLVTIVKKVRESFMSEDDAKKLADNFEEEAAKVLETFLQEHPNAAFSLAFEFFIDFNCIDVINHKCTVNDVDVCSRLHSYEKVDPEGNAIFPDKSETDEWDGLKTRALKKLFRELEDRGYDIGYDKDTSPNIIIYFTVN